MVTPRAGTVLDEVSDAVLAVPGPSIPWSHLEPPEGYVRVTHIGAADRHLSARKYFRALSHRCAQRGPLWEVGSWVTFYRTL